MTGEEIATEPEKDDAVTTAMTTTVQESDSLPHPIPNGCEDPNPPIRDDNNAVIAKSTTKRRQSEGSNLAALRKRYRGGGVGAGFSNPPGTHQNNNGGGVPGNSMILPHKFHLGGNIGDPLNLNGLINRPAGSGTVTPPSDSPAALRSPVKKQQGHVDALVARLPCNPNDPLNLNAPDQGSPANETLQPDDGSSQHQSLQHQQTVKVKKRKRKGSNSVADTKVDETTTDSAGVAEKSQNGEGVPEKDVTPSVVPVKKLKAGPNLNKIVSPAIPQGMKPRQIASVNSNHHHHPLARKKSAKNENPTVNNKLGQKLANNVNGGNSSSDAESAKVSNSSSNVGDDQSGSQEKPNGQDNAGVLGIQGGGKKKNKRKRRLSTKSSKSSSDTSSNKNQETSAMVDGSAASSTTTTTSGETDSKMPSTAFAGGGRGKNGAKIFDRGNYNRYYGSRNPKGDDDPRFQVFEPSWFADAEVLDIGCNIGHVTLTLARDFGPKRVVGIDIDGELISVARKNVQHYLIDKGESKFGKIMSKMYGPLARDLEAKPQRTIRQGEPGEVTDQVGTKTDYAAEQPTLTEDGDQKHNNEGNDQVHSILESLITQVADKIGKNTVESSEPEGDSSASRVSSALKANIACKSSTTSSESTIVPTTVTTVSPTTSLSTCVSATTASSKMTSTTTPTDFTVSTSTSLSTNATVSTKLRKNAFPKNVSFLQCDFDLGADELLETVRPEYDVILALSVTKWVHLHGGDDAIKRFFKRIFVSLRPGGKFLLEPQPWSSYKKRRNLTPKISENFGKIKFKPDRFRPYLLSEEIGFKSVRFLGDFKNKNKGFQRSILLLEKAN